MMKKLTLSLANEAIERILELSADTQITRCMTAKDSPAFHKLTGNQGCGHFLVSQPTQYTMKQQCLAGPYLAGEQNESFAVANGVNQLL